MDYFIGALKKYACFNGRARRKEYWMFTLFLAVFTVIFNFIAAAVSNILFRGDMAPVFSPLLTGLWTLAFIVPSISLTVRRLHDTGRSGWWYFIGFVPCIGSIWLLVLTGFIEGDRGDNKYGSDPKLGE